MQPLQGEVHGSIIKLTEDPGLPDGQRVEVVVRPTVQRDQEAARERLASYKGLEDSSEEDDRILEEIEQERHRPTHRFGPEPESDQ